MLVNIEEVRKANSAFLAMKENGNPAYQNLRGTAAERKKELVGHSKREKCNKESLK